MGRLSTLLSLTIAVAVLRGDAAQKTVDWPAYAGDKASTKYSALDQINPSNIKNLRVVWRQSGMPKELQALYPNTNSSTNWQNTPLMVGGVMYMSSAVGTVVALDATTGKVLWFDTPPERDGRRLRGQSTRGMAYWTDGKDARVIATTGQYLVAVNAKTGERYKDFGDSGQVDLAKGYERTGVTGYRWSSSPLVVKNVIIVGGIPSPAGDILNDHVKAPKEMPPDDIRGYDVRTGKLLWTFHVVPRAGEFGNETWLNDSWKYSGNSGVWSSISADEELGYVYLPQETATGDYYGGTRPGPNLFAESLVCLDVKTGRRVWHFQAIHHGLWDYDFPAAPVLGDVTVNGRRIKAVAQISKQAFVYVFDRVTGQPIWPIEERQVPRGEVSGEWYSPTQPFPTKPPPFDQQGVTEQDLIDFTPELKQQALEIIRQYKYGPLFTPPIPLTESGLKGTILVPGTNGGGNWNGAGFDPETGVLYVPSEHLPAVIGLTNSKNPESTLPFVRPGNPGLPGPQGLPDPFKPPYARLVAIDLNKGEIRWSVANGDGPRNHPALKGLNLPALGTIGRPSLLVTKSFVFLGEGSNTGISIPRSQGGKMFRAFDKKTGAIAWEMELPGGTSGAPMTYMVNGKQYIVVAVGWNDLPGELVALALP